MSALEPHDGPDVDAVVDEDDDDSVDYPDPEDLELDEPSAFEGDDEVHAPDEGDSEQVAFAERVIDRRETPRLSARARAVRSAMLAYKHRDEIRYTQKGPRWSGITRRRRAYKNEYPLDADCSSFVTWCLWDALGGAKAGTDIVNGAGWAAGYTGTQCSHGRVVKQPDRGDLVFYRGANGVINHVAIYVGHGKVVSHGAPPGPQILAANYRPIAEIRSYLP